MSLQPNLAPLAPLLGTWRGHARGQYPTITSFEFTDEWQFIDVGKPFLLFVQRTWDAEGNPKHTETGYLRLPSPGVLEIVAAIPTGQSELGVGSVVADGGTLTLSTDAEVRNTPSAKRVDQITRRFVLDGDGMTYDMHMAAVGQGLLLHLQSELTRQP